MEFKQHQNHDNLRQNIFHEFNTIITELHENTKQSQLKQNLKIHLDDISAPFIRILNCFNKRKMKFVSEIDKHLYFLSCYKLN